MILRKPAGAPALPAAALLEALDEPACLAGLDGAIVAANAPWREALGPARRLPAEWNLYLAFNRARDEGRAEVAAPMDERRATIATAGERLFLVRLQAPPPAPVAIDGPGLDPLSGASPFGIALIVGEDPFGGAVAAVNPALKAMAGEGPCPRLEDVIDARSLEEARAQHAAGKAGPYEATLAAAPERAVHLHLAAAGGRALVYVQDVTEQKQMASRLAQRNRMESVGQLAGGVAHDFNNLLSAIRLRTDELLLRHALGDPSYDSLAEIRETVGRAADVVRQLLTFSRKATLQREVLDLGAALTDTAVLLRR
ncbi:MAG TPA: histidine kinase dimerization/phospho-acceptor domain-containing protein, partial [Caulobacteraceae bacterium]